MMAENAKFLSLCAGGSQAWNPIGSVLVLTNCNIVGCPARLSQLIGIQTSMLLRFNTISCLQDILFQCQIIHF